MTIERSGVGSPKRISVEVAGKKHLGTYTLDKQTVTLWYRGQSKRGRLASSTAETIARALLSQLIRDRDG